jgi:hypothetical protein
MMDTNYTEQDIKEFSNMLYKLYHCWGHIKRMADENPENRDAVFLKELAYVIEACEIPIEVFSRDKHIHPGYVLEKLKKGKQCLDTAIDYFEGKLNHGHPR